MRGEADLSKTYSKTSKRAGKRKQRYVDILRDQSKLTCLFHGPLHSPDECKVLNYFGFKYTKDNPSTEFRQDHAFKKKFGKHKEKNSIV